MNAGFETPEEAAVASFPAPFARVLASASHEDHAVVLLGTNEPPQLYPYEMHCDRTDGRWVEGSSSNGGGWAPTDEEGELGVATIWDEVPQGILNVVIESRGVRHTIPVSDGYYFFADWNYPDSDDAAAWPRVVEMLREDSSVADSAEVQEYMRLRDPNTYFPDGRFPEMPPPPSLQER